MALNETQRNILEGTLKFPFDVIKEFTFADQTTFQNGIDDEKALTALQLILADNITPSQQAKLTEWDVWEGGVEQFRRILNHPAPQNRVRNPFGGLHDNQEGLLGLTARNDATAEAITKGDVVQYITQEVTNRIKVMQDKHIAPVHIEEIGGFIFQPAAVELPIGYLPQQSQQIGAELLGSLQGVVSPAQLMGASPEFRGAAIVGNTNVYFLLRDTDATFEQVSQIYDQSPEKFEQITQSNVYSLLRDTDATFEQVSQIYDQSPEKFEQITQSNVYLLLRDTDSTFEQVSQIYDQSPEEFQARLQETNSQPSTSISSASIGSGNVSQQQR